MKEKRRNFTQVISNSFTYRSTSIVLTIAILLLTQLVEGQQWLTAPCYGYGEVMGNPNAWLRSDMSKVQQVNTSHQNHSGDQQTSVFHPLESIQYYFEGQAYLQAQYSLSIDDTVPS